MKNLLMIIMSKVRNSFAKMLYVALLLGATTSCSVKNSTDQAGGDATGRISVLLPWYSAENKTYEMKAFELEGVSSLRTMEGTFARFFYAPSLKDSSLDGEAPRTSFLKSKNKHYVAKNTLSLEMATIYRMMQDMHQFDKEVGAEGLNSWPRSVGISVRLSQSNQNNNAFYEPSSDSFLFLNYDLKGLPLAINSGVIAHEYFHSLFNKLINKDVYDFLFTENHSIRDNSIHAFDFYKNLLGLLDNTEIIKEFFEISKTAKSKRFYEYSEKELYTKTYVDGLNEGFADFWGYAYTNDIEFINHSISDQEQRSLKQNLQQLMRGFTSTQVLKVNISDLKEQAEKGFPNLSRKLDRDFTSDEIELILLDQLKGISYALGTQYATWNRLLVEFLAENAEPKINLEDAQRLVARSIVRTLPKLKEKILNNKAESVILTYEDVFSEIYENLDIEGASSCEFVRQFLQEKLSDNKFEYLCETQTKSKPLLKKQLKSNPEPSTPETPSTSDVD